MWACSYNWQNITYRPHFNYNSNILNIESQHNEISFSVYENELRAIVFITNIGNEIKT